MNRNVFLVDTENVANHWIGEFRFTSKKDKLVLFIGPKTVGLPLAKLKEFLEIYPAKQVEFIDTLPGKNSMDFFIVSKLAEMISTGPKTHYHVVSNDSGFDPLIQGYKKRGFLVKRMPLEVCSKAAQVSVPEAETREENVYNTCVAFFKKYDLSDVQAGALANVVAMVPKPYKAIPGALNEPLQKEVHDSKKAATIMKEAKKKLPALIMALANQ